MEYIIILIKIKGLFVYINLYKKAKMFDIECLGLDFKSLQRDSNPRPSAYKADALTLSYAGIILENFNWFLSFVVNITSFFQYQ